MTELSPQAQAVYDAAAKADWDWSNMLPASSSTIVAAALRVAAKCSCEEQDTPPETLYEQGYLDALERVFKQMNAIAAELENCND
jgi:hypothetical protein